MNGQWNMTSTFITAILGLIFTKKAFTFPLFPLSNSSKTIWSDHFCGDHFCATQCGSKEYCLIIDIPWITNSCGVITISYMRKKCIHHSLFMSLLHVLCIGLVVDKNKTKSEQWEEAAKSPSSHSLWQQKSYTVSQEFLQII